MLVAVVLSLAVLAVRAKPIDTKQSMALLSPDQRMWSNPCGYPSPFDITLSTPENEVDLSKMRDQMNMSLGTVEVSIKNYVSIPAPSAAHFNAIFTELLHFRGLLFDFSLITLGFQVS